MKKVQKSKPLEVIADELEFIFKRKFGVLSPVAKTGFKRY